MVAVGSNVITYSLFLSLCITIIIIITIPTSITIIIITIIVKKRDDKLGLRSVIVPCEMWITQKESDEHNYNSAESSFLGWAPVEQQQQKRVIANLRVWKLLKKTPLKERRYTNNYKRSN